jgi:hypothetical protein
MRRLDRSPLPRWLALLIALVAASTPSIVSAEPRVAVTLTATSGVYRFDARGFRKQEDVSTWLTGPNEQVMATNAHSTDDRGRVDFRQRMPRHFQPGRWAITVHGLRSNREAIASFDLPYRPPNAELTLSAGSLQNGDTLTITSADFGRSESVSFWFTGPDGSPQDAPYFVESAEDGSITIPATISGFSVGGWAVSVYGHSSDRYGVASFEVV